MSDLYAFTMINVWTQQGDHRLYGDVETIIGTKSLSKLKKVSRP